MLFLSFSIFLLFNSYAYAHSECGANQELTMGGACPPRCQIAYKMCILPAYYRCYCKKGFIWNFELTECIPERECEDKWEKGEHQFILDQVFNENRGYTISCDRMAVCDLSQIERDPNDKTKIIDHTPIPNRFIESYP
ncbi:hypothetical protein PMAYCL1PPCAC_18353, partial [Pristionchus mayeri]